MLHAEAPKDSGFDTAMAVWRRRKWLALLVFSALFSAALGVATFLPNIYQSMATVLVERQQVAETFVRPAVTGEVETRLHTISQKVLSRARLTDLIARFGLYPELRRRATPEAVIERMRRDIKLDVKEVQQAGGRGATIAFTLTYLGRDPETVAALTNTLASFFVEENLQIRARQATGTAQFLQIQLEEVKKKLDEQERRVGEFKERHIGELPEQQAANLATLGRLNAQLTLNNDKQIRAMERRERIARQLAEVDSAGPVPGPDGMSARLAKLNQELTELRTRFSEKYPDVIRVKAEIAALERRLAESQRDGKPEAGQMVSGDGSPLWLKDAPRDVGAEIQALRGEEKALRQAITTYEHRVENTPKREQQFQELSRDYATTKELYTSLWKRYEDAQLAESMEQRQKGEEFRILDPAIAWKQPAAPNRLRLILMGLLFSLGLAVGVVALAEKRDTSFHTLDELRAFSKVPVLASIPRIVTESDTSQWQRRLSVAAVLAIVGLTLIVAASYYLAHENEELVRLLTRGRF